MNRSSSVSIGVCQKLTQDILIGLDFDIVLGPSREKSAYFRTGNNVRELKVHTVQEYTLKNVKILLRGFSVLWHQFTVA
jgi:hypothetical protein